MSDQLNDPFGNIWITSRIRMAAHEKFVFLDKLSHVLLTVYSVALLGFSVFQSHLANSFIGPYSSEISIVLSASILCASLVVWGLDFGQKARDHRDCYLQLQNLYDLNLDCDVKKRKYQEVLERHPNHSDLDYERFLFRKLVIEGVHIRNSSGLISMGFFRCVRYIILELIALILTLALVCLPLIVIYVIYVLG